MMCSESIWLDNNPASLLNGKLEADIHVIFESDFYRILDFRCRCQDCKTSKPEYSESFTISFVRKGNFLYNTFRNAMDSYTGCVLVTKPDTVRTVTHVHTIPDECTIFEFKLDFYKELCERYYGLKFLTDNDIRSTLVKINPDTEFLHFQALSLIRNKRETKLEMDTLVMNLVATVFGNITDLKPEKDLRQTLKRNHLPTIERAKVYMTEHLSEDISLAQISSYSCVSQFHFGRIFKTLTSWTPHQFLLAVRLKKSELLLKTTTLSVMEIAFASGFNSVEHFTAAFSSKYNCPPVRYRATLGTSR